LGIQKDTPEQAIRVIANVDEIQPVPVLFDLPDEILVGGELFLVFFLCWAANLPAPQVIGDEVKKIAQPEREEIRILPTT
jgi:hypothetical protein